MIIKIVALKEERIFKEKFKQYFEGVYNGIQRGDLPWPNGI
jgi:hypothetical protein